MMTTKRALKRKKNKRNEEVTSVKKEERLPWWPIVFLLVAVMTIGVFAMSGKDSNVRDIPSETRTPSSVDLAQLKGGERKPVLSPARFDGQTAIAYQTAERYRELLDHMYCYCNCKQSMGHKSLLSCFTDTHASKCSICQDQAFYAQAVYDQGNDIGQVRQAVDRKFWRPFS